MITPGQASRIACWISLLTSTSQDGKWPLPGACWRRWMCITLAPALKAALASRAISSGVTGTLCCFGSVSTPFSAQVMTALSLMADFRCYLLFEHDLFGKPVSTFPDHALFDRARVCVARQPAFF